MPPSPHPNPLPSAPQPQDPTPPSPTPAADDGDGDDDDSGPNADVPLTMAASAVLSGLPKTASKALEGAGELGVAKVTIRFLPLPSSPRLAQRVFKVSADQKFERVVRFLRRRLGVGEAESVFCYVNSVFAPALDEGVGNLWRCFKVKDELVVAYSMTPAFG